MATSDPLTPGNTQDPPDIDKGTFVSMLDDLSGDPTPPSKSRLPFWSFENFHLLLVLWSHEPDIHFRDDLSFRTFPSWES